MIQKKNSKRAFTLIELIIVIAIIAILVAVLVPTMNGFVSEAKKQTANANARTIYSIAQAEATFKNTPDGTAYGSGKTDSFSTEVIKQAGSFAQNATIVIKIANSSVYYVSYSGADGQLGTYGTDTTPAT